jgi:hypothetical protein
VNDTETLSPRSYREVACDFIARRGAIDALAEELAFSAAGGEKPAALITRRDVKAALIDYGEGRMSEAELRVWAQTLFEQSGLRRERRYDRSIWVVLANLGMARGDSWFDFDNGEAIIRFLDIKDARRPWRERLRDLRKRVRGSERATFALDVTVATGGGYAASGIFWITDLPPTGFFLLIVAFLYASMLASRWIPHGRKEFQSALTRSWRYALALLLGMALGWWGA